LDRDGSEENYSRNSKKKKYSAKAGFGESDVLNNFEEASENIAAICNLCRGKELSCDTKISVNLNYSEWSLNISLHCSF
jgi:hypothetical protein